MLYVHDQLTHSPRQIVSENPLTEFKSNCQLKLFIIKIQMTTFKWRRVALSCAQGIVYIKVIEDLEAPNQVLLITPDTSC